MASGLSRDDSLVKIEELLSEFYDPKTLFADLGIFQSTTNLPEPANSLLNHHAHMTVTVERHHGENVDVKVHRFHTRENWYVREITLVGSQSGKTVLYGIVRLNISTLDSEVWQRIKSQSVPLGRVLIEHNVLREVQLCELWQITAGPELSKHLNVDYGEEVYGRTALIYCDGEPAIELLEIVI